MNRFQTLLSRFNLRRYTMGVKMLPYFHCYRGGAGKVGEFSCSISKIQRMRDAIAEHNTERCNLPVKARLTTGPLNPKP